MLGRRGLLVLSLLGAITLVVQAQVPDLPRPGLFQIVSLKLSGAGCPNAFTGLPSDPAMTMSLEGLSFPLSNMSTQIPGPIQLRTKSCQAHFSIRIREPGWQWAVTTVELKGYLVLEAGANLDVFVSAFWSERPTQMVGRIPSDTGISDGERSGREPY